ncbi:MAG: CPBP family intramembrane metalloprotease [Lachnospiraceae bacterium]|nr:CPBP family intramembrane metalloprotease [Lachnospiraceae bacterium]
MNYAMENKIWRVGGPLFAYFGIRILVETLFYVVIMFTQVKNLDVSAAFSGLDFIDRYAHLVMEYTTLMSLVTMVISIPVFYKLMKKDYDYPVTLRKREHVFMLDKYFKSINYKELILPLALGIVATVGVSRIILMLPFDNIIGSYSQIKEGYQVGSIWMQFLTLGILAPVTEELLFRGLVYKRLKTYYDWITAAYISGIIFGVAHLNLVQGIYGFIMGIVFSFIYEKYKNIVAPIIMHMAANIVVVLSIVNPISQIIDERWYLRIPVGIGFSVLFAIILIKIYKTKKAYE